MPSTTYTDTMRNHHGPAADGVTANPTTPVSAGVAPVEARIEFDYTVYGGDAATRRRPEEPVEVEIEEAVWSSTGLLVHDWDLERLEGRLIEAALEDLREREGLTGAPRPYR